MPDKIGILLTNVGTPDQPTPSAVRRYLKEFLTDTRVVEIPKLIWLPILYGLILPFRSKKSADLYQKIWTDEGSPLLIQSQKIANKLQQQLNVPVKIGMHYGQPTIQSALDEFKKLKINKLIILPLFPQYSGTTTASSFDKVVTVLKKWREVPAIQFIQHYADKPSYIQSLTHSIQKFWDKHGKPEHLLFSFHGIPEKYHNAGDPYATQCHLTARLVAEKLNLSLGDWSVAFQSRLGRAKWLSPYTDKIFQTLPKQGVTNLQVVCPGFAVDCLETLEEISLRGKKQFLTAGGKVFHYIPALNDQMDYLTILEKRILSIETDFTLPSTLG
jgi:ferrochelatase